MATSGLSLVGFMEQSRAITYLQNVCVPNDPSPPALLAQWNDARAKSGEPFSTPGESKVEQIPDAYNAHVETFKSLPWVVPAIQQGLDVRLVGIDELLAFQFHIDLERSEALCADLPDEVTLADALPKCLPIDQPQSPP